MKKLSTLGLSLLALATWVAAPHLAFAHCQVPCGIYDDAARIAQLREDTTTILKADANIAELSGKADAQSMNQLVRWIENKDTHADEIATIITQYFLKANAARFADLIERPVDRIV
ncbi:MAG: superoxide dismutase, partial [Gemmatimonadetes bacterium]|nr:superoxide dismutase [Gemmatimonadota bacterium]